MDGGQSVELEKVKESLIEISTLFYQEKIQEAMELFLPTVEMIIMIPEFSQFIQPLFDAVENKDYIMAADILYHEMACRIVEKE